MQPEGRNFKLVWNYEFEGTVFNVSKWSCRTNFWGKMADRFATPEDGAVAVKDDCAHLRGRVRNRGVHPRLDGAEGFSSERATEFRSRRGLLGRR